MYFNQTSRVWKDDMRQKGGAGRKTTLYCFFKHPWQDALDIQSGRKEDMRQRTARNQVVMWKEDMRQKAGGVSLNRVMF